MTNLHICIPHLIKTKTLSTFYCWVYICYQCKHPCIKGYVTVNGCMSRRGSAEGGHRQKWDIYLIFSIHLMEPVDFLLQHLATMLPVIQQSIDLFQINWPWKVDERRQQGEVGWTKLCGQDRQCPTFPAALSSQQEATESLTCWTVELWFNQMFFDIFSP